MITLLLLAAAAAPAPDAAIRKATDALAPALVETRRDIHRHPELGNREQRTGRLVADRLRALGLEVKYPVALTGAVGILRGGRPGGVVAVRADLDALPIEERNDVPYKSENPGVKHACGHDAHTTIVLGAAEVLAGLRAQLPGTVVFVFQPAEEGPPEGEEGGAPLMIAQGVLDAPRIQAMYGLHVDPSLEVGTVGWSIGPIFASSDRFVVEVEGRKTHGAYPHTGLDPVPVAAEMVQALQLIVSRQIDAQNPKVLTIGSIHGGNRFNIVADKVVLEGTIRTLDAAVRTGLKERMQRTVQGVAAAHGVAARLRFVGEGNPPTLNEPAHTRASVPSLERVYGKDRVLEVRPQMGAEDFSAFAERVPALYVKLGVRNEARGITAMIHTEDFDIDEAALPLAVRAVSTLVWDYLARTRP
ncbi:MAG TPA: M20 family metallopeptidase [Vicinamibacteria bacterium]|jgi:amidohydrolase